MKTLEQGVAAALAGWFQIRDREATKVDGGVRMVFDVFPIAQEREVLARGQRLLNAAYRITGKGLEVLSGTSRNPKGATVLHWPVR